MYLISIYFDEETSKNLQRYINKIAEVSGNHFMTDNNVPPHMTISAIEARSVDELIPTFEKLGKNLKVGEIQFVSMGQLLPYVMYVTPVLNEYLQNLISKVYEEYKELDNTTISKYYQPLSWLPHVTLGKTLEKEQMKKAFEVMQDIYPIASEKKIRKVLK